MNASLEAARREMKGQNWLAAFDIASAAIDARDREPLLKDIAVRALVNAGSAKQAQFLYDTYRINEFATDPALTRQQQVDALSLKGRIMKDRARLGRPENRRARFLEACAIYCDAFERFGDYFPAINAATTAMMAGEHERAEALARQVLADPKVAAGESYYELASALEACLLLGDTGCAQTWLDRLLACTDCDANMRASTATQLSLMRGELPHLAGLIDSALSALGNPPIIVYSGHMFRENDPHEAALAEKIAAVIRERQPAVAFGALACGADIVVAEQMLAAGVELRVVLPFRERSFKAESVRVGGASWVPRFNACLKAARSVTLVSDSDYVGDPEQFSFGTDAAHGLAVIRARSGHARPVQLAVLQPKARKLSAGTARDADIWQSLGHETIRVDPGPIDRDVRKKVMVTPGNRVRKSILFADFKGFSKLSEAQLPVFVKTILGAAAEVLDRYEHVVRVQNSWGDAVYAVIDDPVAAAEIALEMQERLRKLPRGFVKKDGALAGMRIAIHHGPVYRDVDPVLAKRTYFGSSVTLTARLEPVTPVGAVCTTLPFAAILALRAPDRFALDYVGRITLPKEQGVMGMFRLSRAIYD